MPKSGALLASLSPYTSHYRNRKSSVRRQAAEPHLEDGGIYRKWWWSEPYSMSMNDDRVTSLPRAEAIRERMPVKVKTSMNSAAENSTTVAPEDTSM